MSDLETLKLDDVCTFKTGKLNSNASIENGAYPFYTCAQTIYRTNTYSFDTECVILGGNNAEARYPIFYKNGKFDAYQRNYIIEPKDNSIINVRWLYYSLSTYLEYMRLASTGATTRFLTLTILKNIKLNVPSINTQIKIADTLSTYDNLIENNNRRIKILEQAAEELYKEWFVRMRFPGYEKTKFHKGIPEGWEIIRIKDLGEVITGKTPPTNDEENYGGEVMFVKTPDMNGNLFTIETESYLSNKGNDSQPKKLIPEDSIMVSCIGTGGVVSINGYLAHTNQQINSIVLKKAFEREWAYFTLHSMKGTIELFGATGATMTNLSKGKFENLKILYPSNGLVSRYHTLTKGIFSKIKNLNIQNRNLKKQRDLLLPRLMNGTITVK